MNNKEKRDIKTPEEIYDSKISCTCDEAYKSRQMADPGCAYCQSYDSAIETAKEYHDQFKPQTSENEDNVGIKTPEVFLDMAELAVAYFFNNKEREEVILPAMKMYAEQLQSESRNQIESLQKELVVEKERLEKEKRQLLIAYASELAWIEKEEVAEKLSITMDELTVAIAKADLMIKEFLKY